MDDPHLHKVVTGLVGKQLAAGDALRFRVTSDSMAPLIRAGDAVIVERAALQACQIGDVVVIQRERDYLTHRLVHKSGEGWQTKGDNTPLPDPPIPPEAIVGRVTRIQRGARTLNLHSARQRKIARLLAKLSALEWRAFQLSRWLRLPVRAAVKVVQQIALLAGE